MSIKYKAVALDLDGTTLNSHHELTPRTIDVLRKLDNLGVTLFIATGRSTLAVVHYLDILEFQSNHHIPIIVFNGALGGDINLKTKLIRSVSLNPIPETSIRLLINFANELGLVLQYYNGVTGNVLACPKNENHIKLLYKYAELTGKSQIIISSYEEAIQESLSIKVLIMCEDADYLLKQSREKLPPDLFHMIRGLPFPFFVEYLQPNINKGTCLKELMDDKNIDLEHVIAFGDGENDKEMLKEAGLGIAMKNAQQPAKDAANIVLDVSF